MTVSRRSRRFVLNRRRLLGSVAAGGLATAAASLLACGGKRTATVPSARGIATPASAQALQPKSGGTLTRLGLVNSGIFGGGFDAHTANTSQTGLMGLFYQTLIGQNARTFTVQPQLAQKWEQPSDTEYVLTLAPNVTWHNKPPANGRAFTADDVAFNLNRLLTAFKANDVRLLARSLLESVSKVEVVDAAHVRLTTLKPDATMIGKLAGFSLPMLCPEVVQKYEGHMSDADTVVGTGAFVMQAKDDTSANLPKNPAYWKPGLPYLDGIKLTNIQDDQTAWAAFLTGRIDVGYVPGTEVDHAFSNQAAQGYAAEWFNDVGFSIVQPNTTKKPFDDARVTRALRLMVDHKEAVEQWGVTWFGRGYLSVAFSAALSSWDLTPDEYGAYAEFKQPKDAAVKQAVDLLGAAGFTRDTPLQFTLTSYTGPPGWGPAMQQLLQSQFHRESQGAVRVNQLKNFDAPTLASVLVKGDFDYAIYNESPNPPFDPDPWFRNYYYSKGVLNYGKYGDPALDGMIDKQLVIFDTQQRHAAVKNILKNLIDDGPYTSWSGRYQPNARRPRVQGWAPESNSAIWGQNYENVWLSA